MGRTSIEWCDTVWNPVVGCTKVSEGCRFCYAERIYQRFHKGEKFSDVRMLPRKLEEPLHWRKPRMAFVNSMSDLFHPDVTDSFINEVFAVMADCPQHTFMILTKRPERMREYMARVVKLAVRRFALAAKIWMVKQWPLPNVWLGVSVENQRTADERIPVLLQCPAAVRFVSVEPMLGPVDLGWLNYQRMLLIDAMIGEAGWPIPYQQGYPKLDWVICGGESGPAARPMQAEWARSLRDQCGSVGVPFFFKGWGEWGPEIMPDPDLEAEVELMVRVGRKAAGRMLDGKEWSERPGK